MCPMLDWLPLADSTELFVFVLLVLARLLQSIRSLFALLLRLYSKYPARTNRKITTEPISERKARLKMYLPVLSLQLKKSDILMSHLCLFCLLFCFEARCFQAGLFLVISLLSFWSEKTATNTDMKGLCSRTKSCHKVFGHVFYSVAINTDDFRSLWAVSGEFAVPSNGRCVIAGFRIALEVNCYLCTHIISPSSNDQRHKHSAISNPCSIFNHRFLAVYQHIPECVKRILTFWYPNYFGSWKRMTQLTSLHWNSSSRFGTGNQTNLAVIINVVVTILKHVYTIFKLP